MPELADPLVTRIVEKLGPTAQMLHDTYPHEGPYNTCTHINCLEIRALLEEYDEKYISQAAFDELAKKVCAYQWRKGLAICDLPNWQCGAPKCKISLAELEAERFED